MNENAKQKKGEKRRMKMNYSHISRKDTTRQYLTCNTATNPRLKTCPCLSILSRSAAIDWLKRLCESIQSCFGHQRYYINVILRNRL